MKKSGKKWLELQFDLKEESVNGTVPTMKPPPVDFSKKTKRNDFPIVKKRTFNFHQHLTPKTVADLAVHPKKIGEVEAWLQDNVCNKSKDSQTAKFLLITGPTGSGKTATVQVLCRNMDISITEWLNPVDQDFEVFKGPNQVTRFTEFLTESKWNSLFTTCDKKIILVEDFPNAVVRTPEEFANVLEECFYKGNYPIIFICTNSFDSKINLAEKLFTQEIRNKYKIPEISFNACAATLLKNALRRGHNLIQENLDLFKTPSPSTVNAIITTAMGDIKCAINQYYFASLLGTADLPTSVSEKHSKKTGTKRKRTDTSCSIQTMSRDQSLGLFHGIGRVLNPKRIESNGSWRLHCDLEKLIDEFSTQPGSFTSFLFENYLKYFGDVNDACKAAEILSLSQTFLEKWVDRHDVLVYALWVSTMGLMIYNEHKVSKWNQITGPKKAQKRSSCDPARKDLSVTDLYYVNIINGASNVQFNVNM